MEKCEVDKKRKESSNAVFVVKCKTNRQKCEGANHLSQMYAVKYPCAKRAKHSYAKSAKVVDHAKTECATRCDCAGY